MTDATLIYPHQLFLDHPALTPGRPVFLVEEPLLFSEFPTHRDLFARNHHLSMMPKLLEKMSPEKRQALLRQATNYLESLA